MRPNIAGRQKNGRTAVIERPSVLDRAKQVLIGVEMIRRSYGAHLAKHHFHIRLLMK
jgi:hypothetical protein